MMAPEVNSHVHAEDDRAHVRRFMCVVYAGLQVDRRQRDRRGLKRTPRMARFSGRSETREGPAGRVRYCQSATLAPPTSLSRRSTIRIMRPSRPNMIVTLA